MAETRLPRAHPSASFRDLLAHRDVSLLPKDGPRARYLLRARGALYRYFLAIAGQGRNEVLLPAWHCPTMVYAIERAGMRARYYAIRNDLSIDEASLLRQLGERTAAVLVINFFGFPSALGTLKEDINAAGARLLEDCSHSFLSARPLRLAGGRGDAAVYALWKLVPSAVGALLCVSEDGPLIPPVTRELGAKHWLKIAKRLVEEAVENLEDGVLRRRLLALEEWRAGRRRASFTTHAGPQSLAPASVEGECARRYPLLDEDFECGLPKLQKHMLVHAHFEEIAAARRANYEILAETLSGCASVEPLFASLPEQVVPWCFPLRVPERRRHELRMRERGVPLFTFGETLHPSLFAGDAEPQAVATACALRDQVLCIGVHQGLNGAMLRRAAAMVIDVLGAGVGR